MADVIADGFDQVTNAAECAPADSLPRDFGKPAFDLIEPGGTGRREVCVIARALSQPLLHFGMFMGSVIIQHEVDVQTGIDGLINASEKA